MEEAEILQIIEADENFYGAIDYSVAQGDFKMLQLVLDKHWDNSQFRAAVSNTLLHNVLKKSPSKEFINQVLDKYVSGFCYKTKTGDVFKFSLEKN